MSEKLTSKDVEILLERKFCAPEWAFFSQVPRETAGASQIADGIAFNLWPSRGLPVIGFEIKVNRGDWLNELKQPAKSADIQKFCHNWYVVAPKDVVKPEELPKTWGWYEVQGKSRLIQRVKAPDLEPISLDPYFVAAIMRKVSSADVLPEELKARISKSYDDGEKYGRERSKWRIESLESELERIKKSCETFERLTGVNVANYYGIEDEAKRFLAFKQLQRNGQLDSINQAVDRKLEQLTAIKSLLEPITELKEAAP